MRFEAIFEDEERRTYFEDAATLGEVLGWLRQAIRSDLYKAWNAWALVNYKVAAFSSNWAVKKGYRQS